MPIPIKTHYPVIDEGITIALNYLYSNQVY